MAILDIVAYDLAKNQLAIPQSGDTYQVSRTISMVDAIISGTLQVGSVNSPNGVGGIGATDVKTNSLNALTMTLNGVNRNTWPAAGSATVAMTDVLANGEVGNLPVGSTGFEIRDSSGGNVLLSTDTAGRTSTNSLVIPAKNSLLPAITIVDDAYFDNTADPDWLDRCADKSWYNEARSTGNQYFAATYANDAAALVAVPAIVAGDVYYNGTNFMQYGAGITNRAGSQKFPMKGVVTAEAGRVIIWDTTHGAPTMWIVFNGLVSNWLYLYSVTSYNVTSIDISSGIIIIGQAGILTEFNLISEKAYSWDQASVAPSLLHNGNVSQRNDTLGVTSDNSRGQIINNTVNDVAITILPDAPFNEYGMRVPTIAVATDGGVSVIMDDVSVVNSNIALLANSVSIDNGYLVWSVSTIWTGYIVLLRGLGSAFTGTVYDDVTAPA
ncbi:MAG: hypothetical protein R8M45_03925, partial [Ghiorsea sp.]